MKKNILTSLVISVLLIVNQGFSQKKLTFLHTNDIHGNYTVRSTKSAEDGDTLRYGGFIALKHYVDEIKRETNDNYLLFDAGDFMTGNPICDISHQGAKGGALVSFFNYLEYDGLTLGNHEFDISVDNAQALMKLCDFPVFSANLFEKKGQLFTEKAYHIYTKNDLKIGVIGIMVHDLGGYLNKSQRQKIYTIPAVNVINKLAEMIDEETDLIVLLSHSGFDLDKDIAEKLSDKVDIIIGGHSHTRLNTPVVVNDIIIVQAGSKCSNLGRLDVTVKDDRVSQYNGKLIFLDNSEITEDVYLKKQIKKYENLIDLEYGKIIGHLKSDWMRNRRGESNLGNFICDCIRDFAKTDVAVMNSGGIRKGLVAGPVKGIDVKEILPFLNQICVTELPGTKIKQIVATNIKAVQGGHFGILQTSGLEYVYRLQSNQKFEILDMSINGAPVEDEKNYTLATVDYVLSNADQYFGFDTPKYKNLYTPIADVVMNRIRELNVVESKIEGRIIEKK